MTEYIVKKKNDEMYFCFRDPSCTGGYWSDNKIDAGLLNKEYAEKIANNFNGEVLEADKDSEDKHVLITEYRLEQMIKALYLATAIFTGKTDMSFDYYYDYADYLCDDYNLGEEFKKEMHDSCDKKFFTNFKVCKKCGGPIEKCVNSGVYLCEKCYKEYHEYMNNCHKKYFEEK